MKAEFKKTEHLFNKLKELEESKDNFRIPTSPELAFFGSCETILSLHAMIALLSCLFGCITLIFGLFSSFGAFLSVFLFTYALIVVPYNVYIRINFNINLIKKYFLIKDEKEKLIKSYNQALESLDIEYLDYHSFSRNETLILMDKARLEGSKNRNVENSNRIALTSTKIANSELVKNR